MKSILDMLLQKEKSSKKLKIVTKLSHLKNYTMNWTKFSISVGVVSIGNEDFQQQHSKNDIDGEIFGPKLLQILTLGALIGMDVHQPPT